MPTEPRSAKKPRASSATPEGTGTEGLRAQGLRTRNAIIRVATKLLLQSGPLEFSLRAVALRAKISVSNLQYYFPTRPAVLRAIIEPVIEGYLDDLKRALDNSASPREAFDALLERTITDAKDSKTVALLWHFFSFASTDPDCSRLLDQWYDTLTTELATLIRAANPKHDVSASMHIAVLVISMADGLSLHLGTARGKRPYMRGLDERFLATARYLVWGASLEVEAG